MSLVVHVLVEDDMDDANAVLQAAFARPFDYRPLLRMHRVMQPDGFWLARDERRIVGTVGAVDYGSLAYVGLMTVHPDWQRRGIGRQLMMHLLDWLDRQSCSMALLDATDRGARLYERLGFSDDATARVYESVGPAQDRPLAACLHRAEYRDLAEITAFDAPLFGARRDKLFRALCPEHGHRCLLARDPVNRLVGYLFARDPILGPWAAQDERIAADLLHGGLRFGFVGMPQVQVPRSNERAAKLLERFGFVERRALRHMRRGGPGPPGRSECLYGQSTFAHG